MTTSESRRIDLHEDARKIELDLETNVDVRTVDRRTPPERETTIGDLIETGTLGVRELLVTHRLFEPGRLLPEQTLPCREVGTLEECVFQDTFHTSEGGNDIDAIVIELPQLAVMAL